MQQKKRYNLLKFGLLNSVKRFDDIEEYNKFVSTDFTDKNELDVVEQLENGGLNVDNWIVGFLNGEACFYKKNDKPVFCIEHTDRYGLVGSAT